MGRRNDKTLDLDGLVKTAKQAWKVRADAQEAYSTAVKEVLEATRQIVDGTLISAGYVKAEGSGSGWTRSGFWTNYIPVRGELFVQIIGQPAFMAGKSPDQVLQKWSRIISSRLPAWTFLYDRRREGGFNNGPYLSIILQ